MKKYRGTRPSCILLASILLTFTAMPAFAQDDCKKALATPSFQNALNDLVKLISDEKYDEAKSLSKDLDAMCSKSPVLKYMQGKIAERQGDDINARLFYQKASEYSYEFAVKPEVAQKIWYARYEFEHPERTKQSVEQSNKALADANTEIEQLKQQLAQANQQINDAKVSIARHETDDASSDELVRNLMWTGVGLGIGGIIIAGAGAGIAMTSDPIDIKNHTMTGLKYTSKPTHLAGWALVGAGAALTVTGAILTGIFGYKYTHTDEEQTYSLAFAANGASFSMTF